jgi:hypothetical protein
MRSDVYRPGRCAYDKSRERQVVLRPDPVLQSRSELLRLVPHANHRTSSKSIAACFMVRDEVPSVLDGAIRLDLIQRQSSLALSCVLRCTATSIRYDKLIAQIGLYT